MAGGAHLQTSNCRAMVELINNSDQTFPAPVRSKRERDSVELEWNERFATREMPVFSGIARLSSPRSKFLRVELDSARYTEAFKKTVWGFAGVLSAKMNNPQRTDYVVSTTSTMGNADMVNTGSVTVKVLNTVFLMCTNLSAETPTMLPFGPASLEPVCPRKRNVPYSLPFNPAFEFHPRLPQNPGIAQENVYYAGQCIENGKPGKAMSLLMRKRGLSLRGSLADFSDGFRVTY